MIDEKLFLETMQMFNRIINNINRIESMPRDFDIGETLHRSEMHHIEAIGNNEGIIINSLAESMGLTKGTTSQIISRLEKKGLVEKYKDINNGKEIKLRLTERGLIADKNHDVFHAEFYKAIKNEAGSMSQAEIKGFQKILSIIDHYTEQL